MSGLAFHPAIMYRGDDECKETYVVRGSLKNHGPGVMYNVALTYTVESGPVEEIRLFPETAEELGTSWPLHFTLVVETNEDWPEAGAKAWIEVSLTATATVEAGGEATATAMAIIYNTCGEEEPEMIEDPEEPEEPDNGMGIAGLVFHPPYLNAGGVCRTTYTARGSLKNHGLEPVTGVTLSYTVDEAYEDVIDEVEFVYDTGYELTSSKPLRFMVRVHVDMGAWQELGKGESITIQISAEGDDTDVATATMTVRNQCKANTPTGDVGVGSKPDKPAHPLGGPPGQVDKEERSHPLGGPPGQVDTEKPSHPLGGPPGRNK